MTEWNRENAERIVANPPREMLWNAESTDRGDEQSSSDYVDGWNDAVRANALPIIEHLSDALAHIAALTAERDSLRISRDTFRELAEQVHATIGTVTTEFERLTTALKSSVRNQVATAERRAFRAGAQWSETAPLGARDIDTAVAAYVAAGDRHGPIA